MEKRIHRRFTLSAEEVRVAVWRYLKELDQPVPEEAKDMLLSEMIGIDAEWTESGSLS